MKKVAFFLDDINTLLPYKDTSILMMKAFQSKGYAVYFFRANDYFMTETEIYSRLFQISIHDVTDSNWSTVVDKGVVSLSTVDLVMMRKDPPFDMQYVYHTYMLSRLMSQGVPVYNHPDSIRDLNEKAFILHFPSLISPSIITQQQDALVAFYDSHRSVIFKPLNIMGGQGVFHIDENGRNLTAVIDMLTQSGHLSLMAQKYIPDILTAGDKRILIVHGKALPFALARSPKAGEVRANLMQGGTGKVVPLTQRDKAIVNTLSPILVQKQLTFVGIDVIGDYLTEVNVTSPTCAVEIANETGVNAAAWFVEGV